MDRTAWIQRRRGCRSTLKKTVSTAWEPLFSAIRHSRRSTARNHGQVSRHTHIRNHKYGHRWVQTSMLFSLPEYVDFQAWGGQSGHRLEVMPQSKFSGVSGCSDAAASQGSVCSTPTPAEIVIGKISSNSVLFIMGHSSVRIRLTNQVFSQSRSGRHQLLIKPHLASSVWAKQREVERVLCCCT